MHMYKLYLDFETKSFLDIKKVGTHVYASDLSTDILCLAYADPRLTLITPPFRRRVLKTLPSMH